MVNTRFEASKLRLQLKRNGIDYVFSREKKNDFGEPITPAELEVVANIHGLYHEQNSNIQVTTTEGAQTRTKKIPMILCLYDETLQMLRPNDKVTFNSKTFRVTGVVNVQEWSIIADISLEVIDDGLKD